MTDFLLHRTSDGVDLIPRTHEARLFLEPHHNVSDRCQGPSTPSNRSSTVNPFAAIASRNAAEAP
jgi:hypothetical protein